MLAAPYLLFAGLCGLMYRALRRARQQQAARELESSRGPTPDDGGSDAGTS